MLLGVIYRDGPYKKIRIVHFFIFYENIFWGSGARGGVVNKGKERAEQSMGLRMEGEYIVH